MSMTRKHFVAIADAVRIAHNELDCDPSYTDAINLVARNLSDTLGYFNPNFDRARFLRACQPRED